MNFVAAMSAILDGHTVGRASRPGYVVTLVMAGRRDLVLRLGPLPGGLDAYTPTVADREADDWEIVA
ncbi:MAG: hypothetical protein OXG90_12930 [Gammaproteobacteria bacterium]|nr:hypothetical protein [Gammaproteobacteria bacterium]